MEIFQFWDRYSLITQNAFISSEWNRIWVFRTFKIEIQKKGPNKSAILQIGSPQQIMFPLFVGILKVSEKYSWIMQRALKSKEW